VTFANVEKKIAKMLNQKSSLINDMIYSEEPSSLI
jgi:hypothetical protein